MARNKKTTDELEQETAGRRPSVGASIGDRIAAFAMLDGMGKASQAQKCFRLALIGFTNAEIAEMLQTTAAVVASSVYQERTKSRPAQRRGKQ